MRTEPWSIITTQHWLNCKRNTKHCDNEESQSKFWFVLRSGRIEYHFKINVCQLVSFSQCLFADLCVCLLSLCLCVNCVCLFVWRCLSFNVPVYHLMWLNHSMCLCVTSCVCISVTVSMLHFVCVSVKSGCVYHSLWMSIPPCFLSVTLSITSCFLQSPIECICLRLTTSVCHLICLSITPLSICHSMCQSSTPCLTLHKSVHQSLCL